MFFFLLCVAVARVLCPRAAELLDHPGEGGGRAREGSRAKIQQLPAEASTGPGTTRPLTPEPLPSTPVLWSSGWQTDPQSPSDWPIYSETGAGAELVLPPPTALTPKHVVHPHTDADPQLRTQHLPPQAHRKASACVCDLQGRERRHAVWKNKLQQDPNLEFLKACALEQKKFSEWCF